MQCARKKKLRLQIDLLDYRAKDVIAVKFCKIKELKQEEAKHIIEFISPSKGLALNLLLST